jgi:hypothetical protein
VFATLVEPEAFAATLEDRLALVQRLGGPYFTSDHAELQRARAAGAQVAFVVIDSEGADLLSAVKVAYELQPEFLVIRTGSLSAAHEDLAERISRLRAALTVAEGLHRMIVAVDGSIAPLSAEEWGKLPAESLLIDPIGDPEAWRAAATLPGDRGLVLALVPSPGSTVAAEPREVLLWGLRYAASLGGRGGARVGFTERPRSRSRQRVGGAVDRGASERSIAMLADLLRLTDSNEATLREELDPRSFSPAARQLERRHGG